MASITITIDKGIKPPSRHQTGASSLYGFLRDLQPGDSFILPSGMTVVNMRTYASRHGISLRTQKTEQGLRVWYMGQRKPRRPQQVAVQPVQSTATPGV